MHRQLKSTNQAPLATQQQTSNSFFATGAALGLMLFPSLETRREQESLDRINHSLERQHQEFLHRRQEIDNFLNSNQQPPRTNSN